VTYASGDPNVATVSSNGVVTGVASGSTFVTATSQGIADSAQVTVVPIPVDAVTIDPASVTLIVGQTATLSATALSATGAVLTGRTVTWTSGTPAVASVSPSGVVSGVSPGSAVIFASIEGVVSSVTVTVRPVPVATVSISPSGGTVQVGDTLYLTATTLDAAGNVLTGRIVGWSTDNAAVATVSSDGAVAGVASGTALITATSEGQSSTVSVSVTATTFTVTVTPATLTLGIFESGQLTAVVSTQSGKVQPNAPVSWSSSNPFVATVASDGTVRGLTPGTTVISASSRGATGTATVTVKTGG
jgi:uncharacterized protein YjdB